MILVSEDIKKIAMRLREMREIKGKTTEEMAQRLGITNEEYLEYESGAVDMPISFLSEVSEYFGMQVYELLSGDEPHLKVYQHVKNGKGLKIERSKQYNYQHLAYNFANNKVLPLLVTVDPLEEGQEIHTNTHMGQEFDYCLSGRTLIHINGKDVILEEGDSIYYNSIYPHGMAALDKKPSKLLVIVI